MIKKNKISMKSTENFYSSYEHASSTFLSKITFHWVISLLARGNHTTLDFRDLGKLPEEESSKILFEKFQNIYKNEKVIKYFFFLNTITCKSCEIFIESR